MDEVQLMALDGAINILQGEGEIPEATAQWIVDKLRDLRESLHDRPTVYIVTGTHDGEDVPSIFNVYLDQDTALAHAQEVEDSNVHPHLATMVVSRTLLN